MPIHEFKCGNNHVIERTFLTMDAVQQLPKTLVYDNLGDYLAERKGHEEPTIRCTQCGENAPMIDSVPGRAIFFGTGWYQGSPQQRGSYKVADSSKIANELVQSAKAQNGGRITGPKQ